MRMLHPVSLLDFPESTERWTSQACRGAVQPDQLVLVRHDASPVSDREIVVSDQQISLQDLRRLSA